MRWLKRGGLKMSVFGSRWKRVTVRPALTVFQGRTPVLRAGRPARSARVRRSRCAIWPGLAVLVNAGIVGGCGLEHLIDCLAVWSRG